MERNHKNTCSNSLGLFVLQYQIQLRFSVILCTSSHSMLLGECRNCGASLSEEDGVVACMPVYEACAMQELWNRAILCKCAKHEVQVWNSKDASLEWKLIILVWTEACSNRGTSWLTSLCCKYPSLLCSSCACLMSGLSAVNKQKTGNEVMLTATVLMT